jgi:hypothetical protein
MGNSIPMENMGGHWHFRHQNAKKRAKYSEIAADFCVRESLLVKFDSLFAIYVRWLCDCKANITLAHPLYKDLARQLRPDWASRENGLNLRSLIQLRGQPPHLSRTGLDSSEVTAYMYMSDIDSHSSRYKY